MCSPGLAVAQDLKDRYVPISPAACRKHWQAAYEAAGAEKASGRGTAARKRTMHILGGAVMRSWGAVKVRRAAALGGAA
jgi:hypothetical protein